MTLRRTLMLLLVLSSPVQAADFCLTKDEARKKWPKAHLYWHTAARCWDNIPVWKSKRPTAVKSAKAPRPEPETIEVMTPMTYWVVIPLLYVPARGQFMPWDYRIDGAFQ